MRSSECGRARYLKARAGWKTFPTWGGFSNLLELNFRLAQRSLWFLRTARSRLRRRGDERRPSPGPLILISKPFLVTRTGGRMISMDENDFYERIPEGFS